MQETFPAVRDERYKLTLSIDSSMGVNDFAVTRGKTISLNEDAYRDVKLLELEYKEAMERGFFVKGTTYKAIINHEFGHVVANVYKIDSLKIACEITGLNPKEVLDYLDYNLSKYAGGFEDGGEIISEVFADISINTSNEFSRKFYEKVLELTRGDNRENI